MIGLSQLGGRFGAQGTAGNGAAPDPTLGLTVPPAPDAGSGAAVNAARQVPGAVRSMDVEEAWRTGAGSAVDLADAVALASGLPRLRAPDLARWKPLLKDLSRRYLREARVLPLERDDGERVLGVADPARTDGIDAVRLALGMSLPLAVVALDDIEALFERVAADGSDAASTVEVGPDAADGSITLGESVDTLQDLARGAPIVRAIDVLLERAVEVGATDIHLETERKELRIRLRVDGMLRPEKSLPLHLAPAVISRIKILAGLDIAERRLPQDGRANLKVGSVEADIRVAIMPSMYGETAVLRILVKDQRLLDFGRVGMAPGDRERLTTLIAEPHGMVIVTGPTGSGKTTTLATAIARLNDPSRKIVTVEDPVEYQIAGVHQTQVRPSIGITFASALRSFLRHDPDVIMIGEMRDRETAQIGIQAALTGHLVLTTLHTNSAADAVLRLVDMGVEPYLIGSTLRGVVGQRLVRRLCEKCRRPSVRMADVIARLGDRLNGSIDPDRVAYSAGGCEACGQTGYRGRVGIFEVMHVDDEARSLIRQVPDPKQLVEAACKNGMTTMLDDGIAKVADGTTTVEEVLRATG